MNKIMDVIKKYRAMHDEHSKGAVASNAELIKRTNRMMNGLKVLARRIRRLVSEILRGNIEIPRSLDKYVGFPGSWIVPIRTYLVMRS